jgi:hypothetical protein
MNSPENTKIESPTSGYSEKRELFVLLLTSRVLTPENTINNIEAPLAWSVAKNSTKVDPTVEVGRKTMKVIQPQTRQLDIKSNSKRT